MNKKARQMEGYKKAIDARIGEFFDGYVVVGFIGGDPVIIRGPSDKKTILALNVLMDYAMQQVSIGETANE